MKVAIITTHCNKSSKQLEAALKYNGVDAKHYNLNKDIYPDNADYVFAYGTSQRSYKGKRLNNREAVLSCVNKPITFDKLKKAKVDTVEYCLNKQDIPPHWSWVVVRGAVNGRKAEGLDYAENSPGKIPDGALFSEYFEHKYEYRIVVFLNEVVGRYYKREDTGNWYFNNQPAKGFEKMDEHCIRAAKALGIDYVGFDVVAKNKKDFKILEANSGAVLTDEAENAVVEWFINLPENT